MPLSTNTPRSDRSRELIFLGILTAIVIVSRLWAIPASLFEWDDILFARALHKFDIGEQSPHPPGFPVFVALGRIAYAILGNERLALITVNVVFASFLGIALYYFYREVFEDRVIAGAGSLLCCFAPNVWLHSVSPRSDGPALVLGIAALVFAIRSLRSPRSLITAAMIFGLGMGIRVTLLPVVGPTLTVVCLIHLWRRKWKLVAVAVGTTAIAVLVWYVPLVIHTTWATYQYVMTKHAEFTLANDGIFANTENAVLRYRFTRFALDIWGARSIAFWMYGLSAVGILSLLFLRKWRALGWIFLAFVPFICFIAILNTPLSAPVYSLPYVPFFAGLAACGLILPPRLLFRSRPARVPLAVSATIGGLFLLWMIIWTYPVIKMVRSEESPPIRAMHDLQSKMRADRDILQYDGLFWPHVQFFLPNTKAVRSEVNDDIESNLIFPVLNSPEIYAISREPLYIGKGESVDAQTFRWSRRRASQRLKMLSLGRYFDVYTANLGKVQRAAYLDGWYDLESDGTEGWRWMGRKGRIALLNASNQMVLHLRLQTISSGMGGRNSGSEPVVTVKLDSREIASLSSRDGMIEHTITVTPQPDRLWSVLSLETSEVRVPSQATNSNDSRELGLRCLALEWYPSPSAQPLITKDDQFLTSGFYFSETDLVHYWRWMEGTGTVRLPAIDGEGQLTMTMMVPVGTDGKKSDVTVEIGGEKFATITPPAEDIFSRAFKVPANLTSKALELKLSATPIIPPSDPRPMALRLYRIDWRPAS